MNTTINEQIQAYRQRAADDYQFHSAYSAMADELEIGHFLARVRLQLSGYVAALYGRLTAWHAARVERLSVAAFARGTW